MKTLSLLRRSLLVSSTLGLGVLLTPVTGYSANTGNLNLQGTVAAVCDIVVTPVAGVANNLPLGAAQTDLNVASVNERCNDPDGYTVTAASANSSVLTAAGTTDTVPFTFKYNASSASLTSGAVTVTSVSAPTATAGVNRAVAISYANPGFIAAATYSDTITFTIAAK